MTGDIPVACVMPVRRASVVVTSGGIRSILAAIGPEEESVTNPEKASDRTLAGKCLCGAVHYAVADEFVYAANCHCSNCRRTTGSAFKPFAGIARDRLNITQGQDNLLIFGDKNAAHDVHCNTCG